MSDWTARLLGEPLPHPITAGIRRVEGRRELQLSGPLGYVRLDDSAIDDLTALIAGDADGSARGHVQALFHSLPGGPSRVCRVILKDGKAE